MDNNQDLIIKSKCLYCDAICYFSIYENLHICTKCEDKIYETSGCENGGDELIENLEGLNLVKK